MSDGHAGRAKPPRITVPRWGRWSVLLAAIAIPAVAFAAQKWWVDAPPDDIEKVVREAGFDPLVPANRLRGPGALYEVHGGTYSKVCDAGPDVLKDAIKTSPLEERVRRRLEGGRYAIAADILGHIQVGGNAVRSIEYSLKGAVLSEINYEDLWSIQDALLSNKRCLRAVEALLKDNVKVCAGHAALTATTSYKVRVNADAEGKADHGPVLKSVKGKIEQHAGGKLEMRGENELVGEGLYYGIRLFRFCITLPDAAEPSQLTPAST